jgi:hypothetical protein
MDAHDGWTWSDFLAAFAAGYPVNIPINKEGEPVKHPENFRELLAYLRENPRVAMTSDDPRMAANLAPASRFISYENGLMWFEDEATGARTHLPIACHMPAADGHETGLSYSPVGFSMEKFGITIDINYVENQS